MHFLQVLETITLALCGSSSATLLYVTNYSENIITLELTQADLKVKATTPGCGDESQYLTPDFANHRLFCLDENPRKGTIVSFQIKENGTLSRLASVETMAGPVASTLYDQEKGLAVAHFLLVGTSIGAGFTTFDVDISSPQSITPIDSENYTMAVEGTNDLRQEHPHPHDAILDPDERFVLVPDLGTDLIQRYLVNKDGRRGLTRLAPIVMPAGSGPRHGVFVKTDDAPTYFYLLSEMGNSVTGYLVSYPGYSSIELTQVYYTTIHETGGWMPNGKDVLGGEIGLSPDGNFLLVTTRTGIIFPDKMNISFTIPNLDPNNKTKMNSDPFVNFKIDHDTGNLRKIQEFPAGGMVPRHFSFSNDGTMVAVVLSRDQRVMIIDRDVKTGLLTKFRTWVHVDKEPSFVLWKQSKLSTISNERIILIAFIALSLASLPVYYYREKIAKFLGMLRRPSYRPLRQNERDEAGAETSEMCEGIELARPPHV